MIDISELKGRAEFRIVNKIRRNTWPFQIFFLKLVLTVISIIFILIIQVCWQLPRFFIDKKLDVWPKEVVDINLAALQEAAQNSFRQETIYITSRWNALV
jgi:hypothetical protein